MQRPEVHGQQGAVSLLGGASTMVACQCLSVVPKHQQQGMLMRLPRAGLLQQSADDLQGGQARGGDRLLPSRVVSRATDRRVE